MCAAKARVHLCAYQRIGIIFQPMGLLFRQVSVLDLRRVLHVW
jgi:hypothetical protein